jgi:hypothetical protein
MNIQARDTGAFHHDVQVDTPSEVVTCLVVAREADSGAAADFCPNSHEAANSISVFAMMICAAMPVVPFS